MRKLYTKSPLNIIKDAVNEYAAFLSPTYGPAGKKILLATSDYEIKAVDDGVMASDQFELDNELENAVVKYVRDASAKTNKRVGDGTTTAAILVNAIINEALKGINDEFADVNPHAVIKEIKKALPEAVKYIAAHTKKLETQKQLHDVAFNSYNDIHIAKIISELIFKIGKDGVITIDDSNTLETDYKIVQGLEWEKGFVSPYFMTDVNKGEAIIEKPAVFLIKGKLNSVPEISTPVKQMLEQGVRNMVIVAEGFSEAVVGAFVVQKLKGMFSPLLVEIPGTSEDKQANLEDLAAVLGAKIFDPNTGNSLKDFNPAALGSCEKVVSNQSRTIFNGGEGDTKKQVKMLEGLKEHAQGDYEREKIERRIAKITGGIAVIRVGASTENEQKAIKAKVEDAVNATKIAYKHGIALGGGVTYQKIKTSSQTLNKALQAPREQLEKNGKEYLDKNVYDPAGVLIAALESAVSIACELLGMGGIITKKRPPEKEE